jgi:hypothetical protein
MALKYGCAAPTNLRIINEMLTATAPWKDAENREPEMIKAFPAALYRMANGLPAIPKD